MSDPDKPNQDGSAVVPFPVVEISMAVLELVDEG